VGVAKTSTPYARNHGPRAKPGRSRQQLTLGGEQQTRRPFPYRQWRRHGLVKRRGQTGTLNTVGLPTRVNRPDQRQPRAFSVRHREQASANGVNGQSFGAALAGRWPRRFNVNRRFMTLRIADGYHGTGHFSTGREEIHKTVPTEPPVLSERGGYHVSSRGPQSTPIAQAHMTISRNNLSIEHRTAHARRSGPNKH